MKHLTFGESRDFKAAILIKESAMTPFEIKRQYIEKMSLPVEDFIAVSLKYNADNKAPAKMAREYLATMLKAVDKLGITTLLVCDSTYFKFLAGVRKLEGSQGYIMPCAIEGFDHINLILSANYQAGYYNTDIVKQIDFSLKALETHLNGSYEELGSNVIHSADYPLKYLQMQSALQELHKYKRLYCDIETFGLKFYETGIATIGFSWDKHNGIAFPIDYEPISVPIPDPDGIIRYGKNVPNEARKKLIRQFFDEYKGELVFHNANFDVKIIINDLYMDDLLDQEGMLTGIERFMGKIVDTKIIAYLATNSTDGNKLRLKELAYPFAGNYGIDVDDITRQPLDKLLEYNLMDCCSTCYVYEEYLPIMVADEQTTVYQQIMIPSIYTILQMELTGVPIDPAMVAEADIGLKAVQDHSLEVIKDKWQIEKTEEMLVEHFIEKDFIDRKKKAKHPEKLVPKEPENVDIPFNVNSTKHLQLLFYAVMGLPVVDKTKKGAPATGGDTIAKLIAECTEPEHTEVLEAVAEYGEAHKITSTFIKAFQENSVQKADGQWYLHGSFNLGGTVSGRLSSSGPNLQNIPSGSKYAKLIKRCFTAPPGWIMAGADFDSLEDKISALTTKDTNKLKVYEDGYDGHCLRAFAYFGAEMPDIENNVESINSIAQKYKVLRQKSKTPTFALTYGGTWLAIMQQAGIPKKEAQRIEAEYHKLYAESDAWVKNKINGACQDGYVTVAFGLRVRTPLLAKINNIDAPNVSKATHGESRTAGNALGQSYGMLNNRASIEFQKRLLASPFRDDIKPSMQIHDAMYFFVRDRLDVIEWFNNNLPDCMRWQKLPEIEHDVVKLSGAVEIFYPNWATSIDLPNDISADEIMRICNESQESK